MKNTKPTRGKLDGSDGARLVIGAQILVLLALGMGLNFLLDPTGGTLFVAAAVAPGLVGIAVLLTAGVAIYRFRRAHSLFAIEVYQPGQIIFRKGEPGDCAYFIKKGEVEVLQDDSGETVIATLPEGQYFGEMALLSDTVRNATVRARTVATLELVGKENFLALLNAMRSAREDIMTTAQKRSMKQAAGAGS